MLTTLALCAGDVIHLDVFGKVIKGYRQFLYRLMIVVAVIFIIIYAFIAIQYILASLVFILVGWLTIINIVKKLKYQETLLRD